jgi:UDP-N-acetylmuramoyl-L-alanyl-D-glutamate--2,6-diaminopimelate ligase
MKTIGPLIQDTGTMETHGRTDVMIDALSYDSRTVGTGTMFFAIRGTRVDAHDFIGDVAARGASCIVCERLPEHTAENVTYVLVKNCSDAIAWAAGAFYDHPSRKLKLTAVTGTNGKTTVATLLFRLFRSFGHQVGLLSTVQNQVNEEVIPSTHTTPDVIRLNELLNRMVQQGCEYCFMEASSHAIEQKRIKGLHFDGLVFTNLTHDHLDYHKTFDNYLRAKKKLFDEAGADAFALVNKDDKNGAVMLQNTRATRYTYSLRSMADFKAKIIESDFNGMLIDMDGSEAWFRLVGHFNAYNLLAVYGTAFLLGKEKQEIITHLSSIGSVQGRFDYTRSTTGITGIIDYAHTPDALKNILGTINELRTRNEKLITIIGCGGNRDAAKRPVMADVASDLSTHTIFTSDNPRDEEPMDILDAMQKGVKPVNYKKTVCIPDRREAIKHAVSLAEKGDIILLAGKGHEDYQEIKGVKHHFNDKEELTRMFEAFGK